MLMLAAAVTFFTRLPLWRYVTVPSDHFRRVIYFWPFAGWITSSIMVLTLLLSSLVFPPSIAITLAMLSRVLLTGALHEDGLADFMDGFGGNGRSKETILAIMKDSHAGTYAIAGLIFYFLLLYSAMQSLPLMPLIVMIFIADPFCKMVSSLITMRLPYARTEETSKIKTVYIVPTRREIQTTLTFGLLPLILTLSFLPSFLVLFALVAPVITFFLLATWMERKIEGYTGDCAGAMVLLTELSFILTYVGIYTKTF